MRKRLARWVLGTTKEKRHEIDVSQFVASLMAWIVSKWPSKQMALAIDMTHLSDKWIVMAVTVLYGQFGIPVNWRVFRASETFHAREIWPSMLNTLSRVIPKDFDVLVLSDRGLWSPDLFREIQTLGWHPFMRVSGQGCLPQTTVQTPSTIRSGRQMKPYPPTPLPSTEHWLPAEHHLRALVSLGVDIIRASTDPLLDLLAERFSPPRWHVGSGTLQKTKGHVPL